MHLDESTSEQRHESLQESLQSPAVQVGSRDEVLFKVILLGDSNVGKTSLLHRLCHRTFMPQTRVTVGLDFFEKIYQIDGVSVKLQIWDTAGQERFRLSVVRTYYRGAKAVVFVYDVTSDVSFRNVVKWQQESGLYCSQHAIIRVLVGNKADLKPGLTGAAEGSEHGGPVLSGLPHLRGMTHWVVSCRNDNSSDLVDRIFYDIALQLYDAHMSSYELISRSLVLSGGGDREAKDHLAEKKFRSCCSTN